tara:strand:+ start:8522 stop:11125 length:2604 start_codon:yes stop_codon:yes gene_type:complete
MNLQPFLIAGSDQGLENDKKSFLLPDKAYPKLENAYVWRDRVKKREGNKLLGRLRRVLTAQSQTAADGTSDYDITDILSTVRAAQPNAELQVSSIIIRVDSGGANDTEFTDNGNGAFTRTSGTAYDVDPGTYVNYITGLIHIEWDAGGTPPNLETIEADYNYYPSLPVMGILQRETNNVNFESTLVFDTVYCYVFDGTNYGEFLGSSGATWNGSDSQFFQGTNYRGSDSTVEQLFVTNFDNDALSPMRHTNGSSWTDFAPTVGGTTVLEESLTGLVSPWTTINDTLGNLPVIPGTVTITVSNNNIDNDVIFTDYARDGTLEGSPSTSSGTIDYTTGAIVLTITPAMTADADVNAAYQYESTYLFSARDLVPYYGRLLALNTYEGATRVTASNFSNRLRFSQVGSPTQNGAWVSSIFGRGGFIDAPTNEQIITHEFFKNTLIVFFERSTWQLRYVGDYGLPFVWERVSSDFGSDSQFSSVLFDDGVLTVGDRAITAATVQNVQRIDEKIPDLVFSIRNDNQGKERVHGIRDFQKEVVYWCFNDGLNDENFSDVDKKYPDKTLVYNYRNGTFAIFRNSVTAFGIYQEIQGVTWDSTNASWDDTEIEWDDPASLKEFQSVICGNQQGFVHRFAAQSFDDESLSITAIDRTASAVKLTIPNHNLQDGEIIYLENLSFIDTSDSSSIAVTGLNDLTFRVSLSGALDTDIIGIEKWDSVQQDYFTDFSFTPAAGTGTYIGKGTATLLPRMTIKTKDFNPFMMEGKQSKLGHIDFLTDETTSGIVTINIYANTTESQKGNLEVGQKTYQTQQNPLFPAQNSMITWNRFYSTVFGQFISVEITYNGDQMNDRSILDQAFVMNAIMMWMKPGGRIS